MTNGLSARLDLSERVLLIVLYLILEWKLQQIQALLTEPVEAKVRGQSKLLDSFGGSHGVQ